MPLTTQHPLNSPVFAPQRAYLAVEQQPADAAEAERLEQLRQLIGAAPDTADLRAFAEPARQLLGPGYHVHCGSSHIWIKRDTNPGAWPSWPTATPLPTASGTAQYALEPG